MRTLKEYRRAAEAAHADLPPALCGNQADQAYRQWLAAWYDETIGKLIGMASDRRRAQVLYQNFVSPALSLRDRVRSFKRLLGAAGLVSRADLAGVADEPPKE